jgi:hypothetical protein
LWKKKVLGFGLESKIEKHIFLEIVQYIHIDYDDSCYAISLKKNRHNKIVLYEVIRMFYFLKNTAEKDEQRKKKR